MSTFDSMIKDFTELSDLKAFCESQNKVINDLTKENNRLQQEINSIRSINLNSNVVNLSLVENPIKGITPVRLICEIEIHKLQQKTISEPLTYEETKRLDILTKNLVIALEEEKKASKPDFSQYKPAELLKLEEMQ